jgi:pfkB family carbohydrate kinase
LTLPDIYKEAIAAHICALPFSSLTIWSSDLKKTSIKTTSIEPADELIHKNQFHKLSSFIHGFTISIIKENQLRNLYMNPKAGLWEMIENFASIGNEIVVIRQGQMGQLVYDTLEKKRWHIPAYPAKLINPTGIADAYCGGFLAGYCRNFDPLEAAVYGNVSASMVMDGIGIVHPLKAMDGLSTARLNKVKGNVRRI